jgi:hypothetical protein
MANPRLSRRIGRCAYGFAAMALLTHGACAQGSAPQGQSSGTAVGATPPLSDGDKASASDVRELLQTVKALQSELSALHLQLTQVQADERRSQQEVRTLQDQLSGGAGTSAMPSGPAASPQESYDAPRTPADNLSATPMNSAAQTSPKSGSLDDRLTAVEDDQELLNSKLVEQSQTKVESGSKYRVRFSGLILLNLYDNRGYVDNSDFPQIALQNTEPTSNVSFGGTLRQSQVGVEAFGPEIAGARTSANIRFDFAGGFSDEPNGSVLGMVRLRTGTIRFDWHDTSIVAGQDHLFFAPLAPTSFATVAIPALSYAGNLWAWTPQVRLEHTIHLSETSSFVLQGGVLDSLSGDEPFSNENDRYPQWGEQSGLPAFAARVAWTHPILGQPVTLGAGGYYGRQYWGFGRDVGGWASTLDVSIPLGKMFALTGAFYRGRAVGGLGGGLGIDVVMNGSLMSSSTVVQGLDSMGGWTQLKFKPWQKFEINGAFGEDNPFAGELDRFPAGQGYYGLSLTRNQSPMVNFIYTPRSDMEMSFEYRRLKTMVLDQQAETANHFDASIGYRF